MFITGFRLETTGFLLRIDADFRLMLSGRLWRNLCFDLMMALPLCCLHFLDDQHRHANSASCVVSTSTKDEKKLPCPRGARSVLETDKGEGARKPGARRAFETRPTRPACCGCSLSSISDPVFGVQFFQTQQHWYKIKMRQAHVSM